MLDLRKLTRLLVAVEEWVVDREVLHEEDYGFGRPREEMETHLLFPEIVYDLRTMIKEVQKEMHRKDGA
jgi:hypothetical protein